MYSIGAYSATHRVFGNKVYNCNIMENEDEHFELMCLLMAGKFDEHSKKYARLIELEQKVEGEQRDLFSN